MTNRSKSATMEKMEKERESMNITWLGHACFLLEQDGFLALVDPYRGVEGYGDLHARAHAVYCSHGHDDHSYTGGVTLLGGKANPFTVREIESFHDDRGGALRGANKIRCFTAGGVTVVHLGDLGHLLSPEQVDEIGPCDVLLLPVGGVYTVDAPAAKAVAEQIAPRCIVPMHYRHAPYGLSAVDGVERFAALYGKEEVEWAGSNRFAVTAEPLPPVLVLRYRAE